MKGFEVFGFWSRSVCAAAGSDSSEKFRRLKNQCCIRQIGPYTALVSAQLPRSSVASPIKRGFESIYHLHLLPQAFRECSLASYTQTVRTFS